LGDPDSKVNLFEDKVLAIGRKHIVVVKAACGLREYEHEKERIRDRHRTEFEVLFDNTSFKWAESVDPDLFEDLIKDLLEREPLVLRVRKMANTGERDGGTDLTAEWNIIKRQLKNEDEYPFEKINVVFQCKAHKDSVGKSEVLDIRDTVDARGYRGYFLAVSGYMKKSLTDFLDKLRNSGQLWVDWWTRSEIEDRLRRHEDLIVKYRSIVSLT